MIRSTPIRSCASVAFPLYDTAQPGGVVSVYAEHAHAFDDDRLDRLTLLADHCALVVNRTVSEHRATSLEAGLRSARTIGAAIGILVERHRYTYEQAFELLSQHSQRTNRKLRDVADALVHSGQLPDPSNAPHTT